jgi:hypothetical protein
MDPDRGKGLPMKLLIVKQPWRLLVGALVAVAGCRSMPTANTEAVYCDPHGGTKLDKFTDKIADDIRNFDQEQLHPDHCWPDQYSRESRRRVNNALAASTAEAMRSDQTIWTHYFEQERGKEAMLSDAGKHRLDYLARRRPYPMTDIILQTSYINDLDQARIGNIMAYITTRSQEGGWNVALTNRVPTGLTGHEAMNAVTKTYTQVQSLPNYEPIMKQGFYQATVGGGGGGGGGQ